MEFPGEGFAHGTRFRAALPSLHPSREIDALNNTVEFRFYFLFIFMAIFGLKKDLIACSTSQSIESGVSFESNYLSVALPPPRFEFGTPDIFSISI